MIIQQDASNYYVWVADRAAQLPSVMSEFKLLNKEKTPHKYVQIQSNGQYTPKGGVTPLPCTTILAKDKAIFVMNNSFNFSILRNDARPLSNALNRFGSASIVNIDDNNFKTPISVSDSKHLKSGIDKIAIGQFINSTIENKVDQFIHRMKTDNGKMLLPLTRKFVDVSHIMGGNKSRLTGYADLNIYLRMLNQPTLNSEALIKDMANSNYLLNVPEEQVNAMVVVDGVENGNLKLHLKAPIKMYSDEKPLPQKFPFLLFTLKPITLKEQKFPFFVMPYKHNRLFVTAMILDSMKPLESLSGGLNLLK